MIINPINYGNNGLMPEIIVTADEGSTLTLIQNDVILKTYILGSTKTQHTFVVKNVGEYTVRATKGTDATSRNVLVDIVMQYHIKLSFISIYGISRDIINSSPAWERTDKAVGMTATATVGDTAGSSDFNNCYPWSGIVRETLSTGDVMVKIPKFYFQRYREGNVEHIRIANKATSGFTLHPLFNHGGVESECAYVGAYKTSSSNKSVSGANPQVSQTRATMRNNAKAKGVGWSLIDIAALSAIQMLILVEFANNDVQSVIGRGYCDSNGSSARATGSCDNVSGLTGRPTGTDGLRDVVWRGIEGFWGNVWEWVDGVNWGNGTYYVCNNQSKYADGTTSNYTELSFTGSTNWSGNYIVEEGLDITNNHVILPRAAIGGSSSTYECDACWSDTGWRVFQHGGFWNSGSFCGLFMISANYKSSESSNGVGSRLLYIPS